MKRLFRYQSPQGLSRTECIILIGCIAAIVCLVVPGLFETVVHSRGQSCQDNLKRLGIAACSLASTTGEFPGYLQGVKSEADSSGNDDLAIASTDIHLELSWAAMILPHLDQQPLWESVVSNPSFDWHNPPQLDVLRCPIDVSEDLRFPSNSYVANSGMPDIVDPAGANPSDLKANGVFHDLRAGRNGPQVRLGADIRDGQDYTLLFTENIHRDQIHTGHNWLTPSTNAVNSEQWYGFVWVYDKKSPLAPSIELIDTINTDARTMKEVESPYAQYGSRFARPASNHPGLFLAAFASGGVRAINENIDYQVYQQLMTPAGAKAKSLANSEADMTVFMRHPITNRDF